MAQFEHVQIGVFGHCATRGHVGGKNLNRVGIAADAGGYRVDAAGPVATTDVLYPGIVWLNKMLDSNEREDLTCIFAGLMLYQGKKDK